MMIPHALIASLNHLHGLLAGLLEPLSDEDVRLQYHPDLAPLAWYFGRAVYLEAYWLREVTAGDADLTSRVRHIFADDSVPLDDRMAGVPPKDHLLNWALEIFDHDLTRLANPGMLPDHPLLRDGWIVAYLIQVLSQCYEDMVVVLTERRLQDTATAYSVQAPLVPRLPRADAAAIDQGHYRIGAREGVVFDNEVPAMSVELHNFRIQRQPVTNAEFLAFLVDGGYVDVSWWRGEGNAWRTAESPEHPHHWRRDAAGRWYGVGVNGPADLVAEDPVHGVNCYEAEAFARWAAGKGEDMAGAVLQHEFQWEVAARGGHLGGAGRVWEWCGNVFEPYEAYEVPQDPEMATRDFDGYHYALRGAALHTQTPVRRATYRGRALPRVRHRATGLRLVLPPLPSAW